MADPFDRLLVDPAESTLVAVLEEASGRPSKAPAGGAAGHWRALLDEVAENREGRSQLEHFGPRQAEVRFVAVAWWTDHGGSKHARVCGGTSSFADRHPHHSRMDRDLRPPLWHVYPERIYRVCRPGEEERWVASCACGATGAPEQLAWMGPCCGPCHDRRQDGEVRAFDSLPSVLPCPGPVYALAFSPEGDTLGVSSDSRVVSLFDMRDGEWSLLHAGSDLPNPEQFHPLAFSPDGQLVAVSDPQDMLIRLWPRSGQENLAVYQTAVACGLTFSPDSRLLACCLEDRSLSLYKLTGIGSRQIHRLSGVRSACFSPDGRTLALGDTSGNVLLLDPATWTIEHTIPLRARAGARVLYLDYPAGGCLAMIAGNEDSDGHFAPWMLRTWNLTADCEEHFALIPCLSAVDLSPDGRYLAWIVHDEQHSPAEVTFWDLLRWREACRVQWDAEETLRDVAFSPDGQTLALGGNGNLIKLVPWRLLLEG
jgi:hypothetical protein